MTAMHVQVKYFASIRETLGVGSESVTTQATILNPDGTVASSPSQDRQAGGDKSGSDDDEDDDKDD